MENYQYCLEKGSRKHVCPDCQHKNFVRYIDLDSNEYLPEQYGRCDREINCGYQRNPYTDGYNKLGDNQTFKNSKGFRRKSFQNLQIRPNLQSEIVIIPSDVLEQTLCCYDQNTFLQNLLSGVAFPFNNEDVNKVIGQYYLGTISSGYRARAVTFPYIDIAGNVRAIQVKQFDGDNHTIGTDFIHSIIKKEYLNKNLSIPEWVKAYEENQLKVSCLFGTHLLDKYPLNPIALVEAPKTAIYGTLYLGFPANPKKLLWLAVFNLSSLNLKKCEVLKGRRVYLYPDLSADAKAFNLWSHKAKELSDQMPGTTFIVSNLLETLASESERAEGLDLADYLIKLNWRDFNR